MYVIKLQCMIRNDNEEISPRQNSWRRECTSCWTLQDIEEEENSEALLAKIISR